MIGDACCRFGGEVGGFAALICRLEMKLVDSHYKGKFMFKLVILPYSISKIEKKNPAKKYRLSLHYFNGNNSKAKSISLKD